MCLVLVVVLVVHPVSLMQSHVPPRIYIRRDWMPPKLVFFLPLRGTKTIAQIPGAYQSFQFASRLVYYHSLRELRWASLGLLSKR
jgi:hypothetical protein